MIFQWKMNGFSTIISKKIKKAKKMIILATNSNANEHLWFWRNLIKKKNMICENQKEFVFQCKMKGKSTIFSKKTKKTKKVSILATNNNTKEHHWIWTNFMKNHKKIRGPFFISFSKAKWMDFLKTDKKYKKKQKNVHFTLEKLMKNEPLIFIANRDKRFKKPLKT